MPESDTLIEVILPVDEKEVLNDPEDVLPPFVPYFWHIITGGLVTICLLTGIIFYVFLSPPENFGNKIIVQISAGSSISDTAQYLYDRSIIRSRTAFKLLMRSPLANNQMIAGDYYFDSPISTISIVKRLARGDFQLKPVKITFPEGINNKEIGKLLSSQINGFQDQEFIQLASTSEGYLFPDTYFFSPLVTEDKAVAIMTENYKTNIKPLKLFIISSGRTERQIITMASIVELEASTPEDRRIIADILWRRLDAGIPLQVDAVFPYILGKNTFQVSTKDLQIDSPYNTYRYKGLPPGPIGNPGLEAIKAVLEPTKNNYVYYLSDKDGVMHYAKTYAEHLKNKAKYLK